MLRKIEQPILVEISLSFQQMEAVIPRIDRRYRGNHPTVQSID